MGMNNEEIVLKHGYISIPNYNLRDCSRLEGALSEYNEITHSREYIGLTYDRDSRELRVPIGVGANYVSFCTNREVRADFSPDRFEKVNIEMDYLPRNDIQKKIISYVIGNSSKYSQVAIIAGTGVGKTFCAISSAVRLGKRILVISHSSKLRTHWGAKLKEYTDLTSEDIAIVDKSRRLLKITESDNSYKVIITTHHVLSSLGSRTSWSDVQEVIKNLRVGTLIIDEVHRRFNNTVRILTHSNQCHYILLTATFKQSGDKRNRIFQLCFSSIPKFQQSVVDSAKSQNHIAGFVVTYNTKPSMELQLECEAAGNFNTARYDNYLVEEDPKFHEVFDFYLKKCIDGTSKFKAKGLILCGSINACEIISKYVYREFGSSDFLVGMYHSKTGMNQADKDAMLETADIIVTTSGSLGEGTDIPYLHYVIDIETWASEIANEQHPGRLRDLDDGHNYIYIKIANVGFKKVARQLKAAIVTFKKNMGNIRLIEWKKGE